MLVKAVICCIAQKIQAPRAALHMQMMAQSKQKTPLNGPTVDFFIAFLVLTVNIIESWKGI